MKGCVCLFGVLHAPLGLYVCIWSCVCLYEAIHICTRLYVPVWGCVLVRFLRMGMGLCTLVWVARALMQGCACLCRVAWAFASLSVLLGGHTGCIPLGGCVRSC